jgi:hypothetical protein
MGEDAPAEVVELLIAGQEAVVGGAWQRARSLFAASLEVEETPEGLEGLGTAAWFLDDASVSPDYGSAGCAGRRRGGRSHSDARVGCIVWSTTASSSPVRASRSVCWRSRALKAWMVWAAS